MQQLTQKFILFCAVPAVFLCGSWVLTDYSCRPGAIGLVPTNLSSADAVIDAFRRGSGVAKANRTLIVFYHPHCPCTNATVRNIERIRLAAEAFDEVDFLAVAYCPSDEDDSWTESVITRDLRKAGAEIVVDYDAGHASKFGMATSGHVLLYDENGQLLFSGGVTGSRGHEGMCLATTDILARVNGKETSEAHWPVFGCPLVGGIAQ